MLPSTETVLKLLRRALATVNQSKRAEVMAAFEME